MRSMVTRGTRRLIVLVCAVALTGMAVVLNGVTADASPTPGSTGIALRTAAVCGRPLPHHARCNAVRVLNPEALVRPLRRSPRTTTTTVPSTSSSTSTSTTTTSVGSTTTTTGASTTTTVPTAGCTTAHAGYTPCDLQSAYSLPSAIGGSGRTVAIVDAYDDPKAETDLTVYRGAYGLPACTSANGCFRKVDQNGGTAYPSADTGWSEEISLDLDMVSAVCPNCHILLVEANSNSLSDLLTAEDRAASMGASAISNSWGAGEFLFESLYDSFFDQGIPITASAGDSGYGVEWPAASPYVVAVGGTTLNRAANSRGWSETAWNGTGSGCSAVESKPAWQHDSGCADRTVSDVSAVADPHTGVATYDTYNVSGWVAFGGTSVAAPIIASVYALAGNATTNAASIPYAHAGALNDVTSGSNGTCKPSYLCNAAAGYDGPTGLGTPNNTTGF
jgi:subtilase family serine protease